MTTGPGRVLVVDDDESIREVASLALRLVGHWSVTSAADGAAALQSAVADRPDVILLDVMMPVMDGLETLVHLRADPLTASIPVVLMTAKAATGNEAEFQGLGAIGVLAKPFDPMTLAIRLRQLLDDAPQMR